jgi:hypothetical protein
MIGWDTSKKWVSVYGLDPSGYVYNFGDWYASLGSINQDFGSYAEVGLVTTTAYPIAEPSTLPLLPVTGE